MSLGIGPRATTEYGMGQEYAALCMWVMHQGLEFQERSPDEIIAQLRGDVATLRAKAKRRKKAYRELERAHRVALGQREEALTERGQLYKQRNTVALAAGMDPGSYVEHDGRNLLAAGLVGRVHNLEEALRSADETLCSYINEHDQEAQGVLLDELEKTLSQAKKGEG